ncbi:MAG TPA: SusC/RagA family TonB-linked outer membrane protein [Chitinophagaceae bacterium]|nr:SusC/RagA family TonB-linked outer membrane protein [Chitinophagaceae bacterium]
MLAKLTLKGSYLLLLMLAALSSLAQRRVEGKVTGPDSKPVYGATVSVKGTNLATTTTLEGAYAIQMPANTNVLIFSYVGYEVAEVTVTASSIDVTMKLQSSNLNEVVVTGYSAQRKKDITGSVAVVNVNNLKVVPSGTTEALLQGQASGVTVINSGSPGAGSNVRVRGITSVGSTDPLVIIDGTPGSLHDLNVNDIESMQVLKDAGAASIYGVRGSNGVIIVTTKKGKTGRARVSYDGYYGVQIADKDGFHIANSTETMNATQSTYFNDSQPGAHKQFNANGTQPNNPSLPTYIFGTGGAPAASTVDPTKYALYTDQYTLANKTGTDWFHEVFKNAPIQSHNVSVSTGNDRSSFFFSVGYFNQQGTLIETYLKRYSARINTSFNIGNFMRIGENAYFFYKKNPGFNNQNEGNGISMSYRESPLIPVYDIKGNFAGTGSQGLGNAQNPVANMRRTHDNKGNDYQVIGNVFAEVDFMRNLTARTSFGGTIDNYYYSAFGYTAYENAENNKNPNNFQENFGYNSSWTWTNTLTYNQIFGQHSIKAVVGCEAIQNYGRAIQGVRSGYFITNPGNLTVDPNLWTLNFGPPNGQTTGNINGTPYASTLWSVFGRADYSYREKYLLSATLRRDGASVFGEDSRFGVFPSVTAAWRIGSETFMKDVSWIRDLKIRGGWGKLGSLSNINATNAFSLFNQGAAASYYDINGANTSSVLGIYASQIGNSKTTWEEDVITNIGFDASLFKRLDVSIEWYQKSINGLLFRPLVDITVVGGATPAFINAGDIKNTGIDASITYHGSVTRDLQFDATLNITTYKNQVVALPPGIKYYDPNSAGSTRLGNFTRLQAGQALGAFFGLEQAGVFMDINDVNNSPAQQFAAPGRIKFRDVNGDKKIDENDRTFFGNPNPDFTAGLNLSATYKRFDLSFLFYSSVGNDVINYVRFWSDFPQVWDGAISKDAVYNSIRVVNSSGQPVPVIIPNPANPTGPYIPNPAAIVANPGAKVPVLERAANYSTTNNFSSYYLENGSFLKCKALTIGYTLPQTVLRRFGMDKLRIYAQALNLFTITKYTGLDPELVGSNLQDNRSFGIDFGNYPANQRGFNFGVNLTF